MQTLMLLWCPQTLCWTPGHDSAEPAVTSGPLGVTDRAEGAARDLERKGPSLGPNAGGVSLDRRRLGTTVGTGDKNPAGPEGGGASGPVGRFAKRAQDSGDKVAALRHWWKRVVRNRMLSFLPCNDLPPTVSLRRARAEQAGAAEQSPVQPDVRTQQAAAAEAGPEEPEPRRPHGLSISPEAAATATLHPPPRGATRLGGASLAPTQPHPLPTPSVWGRSRRQLAPRRFSRT
ncbi:hypothetical protein TREES_T100010171 [Tupaia chinensis]|uniref:Uncharacterized protein n=1 Tax=Tupaia chinensis TaxID=246437 RepID=L9JBS8_TUPCH|nr:hypothetical protein TREES_T100010171 [Tupaia chinensis]